MKKEQKIILAAGTAIFLGAAVYGAVSWQYAVSYTHLTLPTIA